LDMCSLWVSRISSPNCDGSGSWIPGTGSRGTTSGSSSSISLSP
jgi:hypothetical protein